jgi:hypothetical protein
MTDVVPQKRLPDSDELLRLMVESANDVAIFAMDNGLASEKWRGIFRSCGQSLELCWA